MDTPAPDYAYYSIVKNLNLFDAPGMGTKFIGVIPGGVRVAIVKWHMDEQGVMWACIGGYPAQWIRAYHNNEKNVNYIGGDE